MALAGRRHAIPPPSQNPEHPAMKLRIQGREYPVVTPETAELLHLMELKQQSKPFSDDGKGLGMNALQAMGAEAAAAAKRGDADADAAILWMAVLAFLARRASGEEVTFRDAAKVPLAAIEAVPEDGDEIPGREGEADPTTPGPDTPVTPDAAPSPAAAG